VWPSRRDQGLDLTHLLFSTWWCVASLPHIFTFQHVMVCDPLGVTNVSTLHICFLACDGVWPFRRGQGLNFTHLPFSTWWCVTLWAWPTSQPYTFTFQHVTVFDYMQSNGLKFTFPFPIFQIVTFHLEWSIYLIFYYFFHPNEIYLFILSFTLVMWKS